MRLGWDGMPRDLPLSREERRVLRDRVRALPPDRFPRRVALVPGGVMLLTMLIWMPALERLAFPWAMAVLGVALCVQVVGTMWLMRRMAWPYMCRQMAIAGYEVCPRCGYPQRDAPADGRRCSECGAERVRDPASG